MRLAVLKMGAVAGDVAANLALIDAAAGQAAAGGARLLVAPELALTGYGAGEAIRDLAEPADGPQVARLRSLAKAHGLGIVAGFAERDGEHIFNSLVLADGEAPPRIYRKTHQDREPGGVGQRVSVSVDPGGGPVSTHTKHQPT